MENKLTLNKKALKYVSHAISKNKMRPVLHGVQILTDGDTVTYTATDGTILLTLRDALPQPVKSINTVLYVNTIKAILKSKQDASLCLDSLTVHCAGMSYPRYDAGQYPDWKRFLWQTNTQAEIKPAIIAASILDNVAKAFVSLTKDSSHVACLPVFQNPAVDNQYYMAISKESLQSSLAFLNNRPGYLAIVIGFDRMCIYRRYSWLA